MSFFSWLKDIFSSTPPKTPQPPVQSPPATAPANATRGWTEEYTKLLDEELQHWPLPELPTSRSAFFKALAVAESGLDPAQVYREPAPLNNNSVGLLQLSLSDVANYGAEELGIAVEADLKNPIKNLRLGVWILSHLHAKHDHENIYACAGRYWSTLKRSQEWPGFRQDGFKRFVAALPAGAPVQTNPPTPIVEPIWVEVAKKELHIHEIAGVKNNPRILEYHAATSLHASDDETPWCSSFMNWVMKQCGIKGTNSAAAVSWNSWGKKLDRPVYGCIVVFKRTGGHHVAIWIKDAGPSCQILGGNQNDEVCFEFHLKDSIIGYRWPA